MSSAPFCLGIPVVDSLDGKNGSVVLRTGNEKEAMDELRRVCRNLTKNDDVKAYFIGYRPDYPAPVTRFFTEVKIDLGANKDGYNYRSFIGTGFWSLVMCGEKDGDQLPH